MDLKDTIVAIHHYIEANEHMRISPVTLAKRLGISPRAYKAYMRGELPAGMIAFVKLLSQLDVYQSKDIVKQIKRISWVNAKDEATSQNKEEKLEEAVY